MRPIRCLLSLNLVLLALSAVAQKDTLYFKGYNTLVAQKDSADYYRVIDSKDDNGFAFTEYRKDGSWVKATAKNNLTAPRYDGVVTWYYPNGQTHERHEYSSGRIQKTMRYYDNGTLQQTILYNDNEGKPYYPGRLVYEADASGKANIFNGDGMRKEEGTTYLSKTDVEHYTMEGPYKGGLKDGVWKGNDDRGITFNETYAQGQLVSGTAKDRDGKAYSYLYIFQYPIFKDGRVKFELALKKDLKNPADTVSLGKWGRYFLRLDYTVNEDGSVSDVKGYTLTGERNMGLELKHKTDKWAPATLRGIPMKYPITYNVYTPPANNINWVPVKGAIMVKDVKGNAIFKADTYLDGQYKH